MTRVDKRKATAVGINHLALEVGDIEAALEFYGRFLEFELWVVQFWRGFGMFME